jgi:DNA-binding NtrC family response regulator
LSEAEIHSSILIVDDDTNIRETIRAILEQEGYIVETARDGHEAIMKSDNAQFDLAMVDMRLPDMMGTELLGKIKPTTPKMQKIILTGYPSMKNAIDSVNQGADGYILKPVDAGAVLSSIKEHLQRRKEEAKYSEQKVKEYIVARGMELDRQRRGESATARKSK